MHTSTRTQEQLTALASHLTARRAAILEMWRAAVDSDPDLTTGSSLSRTLFNDHIPAILDAFTHRLQAWPEKTSLSVQQEEHTGIISHGLHRWQQGFRLRELTREWGYLQLSLVDEIENYAKAHPELEPTVIATALRALTHLCVAGVSDSAEQYWQLHQAQAVGHVRDLERGLAAVSEIEKARAAGWHQAAHDLRGSLSMVVMASELLSREDAVKPDGVPYADLLQKSVSSLHGMLSDLLALARLEAGHEQRKVAPFDAAALLNDFCLTTQPVAEANGLYLKCEGPSSLLVEGDRTKVQRIIQNLVLNALKYSQQGGVVISWERRKESDADRWMLTVQDSGPGFHQDSGIPMADRLYEATQNAHAVEDDATANNTSTNQDKRAATVASQSPAYPFHQQAGEGIGLSIVKGLCDLLDATLELETSSGQGSTFRVTFPSSYNQ